MHNLFRKFWGGNTSSSKSPLKIRQEGGNKGIVNGDCLCFEHRRWGKEIIGCILCKRFGNKLDVKDGGGG